MATRFASSSLDSFKLTGVVVTNHILGQGSYAAILELEHMGLKCAGKKIHDTLLKEKVATYASNRFEDECRLLFQVNHPNIVQFLGIYYENKKAQIPLLVMEYLPTNLTSCIDEYGILPKEICYSILHDVALGLHYLHNRTPSILHRDLSSNNILLSPMMVAKISDLGMARILNLSPLQISRMTQAPGTLAYMPPEVLVANPKYDTSIDVFSYGILMIHIFSGRWPEPQIESIRTEANKLIPVSEAERRAAYLQIIGDNPLMDLILRCINNNPQLRPSTGEIVQQLNGITRQFPDSTADRWELLRQCKRMEVKNEGGAKTSTALQIPVTEHASSKVKPSWIRRMLNRAKHFFMRKGQQQQVITSKKEAVEENSKPPEVEKLSVESVTVSDSSAAAQVYVARYDFEPLEESQLQFNKGDLLYIETAATANINEFSWWLACCKDSGKVGYVPNNYVAKLNTLEAEEWFFEKTSKNIAERMLLHESNQCGSYLVRESETVLGDFSLSVRSESAVRHYRIRQGNGFFFISRQHSRTFKSIVALVAHYKQQNDGLCVELKQPCFPIEKPLLGTLLVRVRHRKMDHKQIDLVKKLGASEFGEVWEGIWNKRANVAIKVFKPGVSVCFDSDFMQDIEKFCHQNIVQFYGIVKEEPIYIVTELMKHGCLLEYLCGDGRSKKLPLLIDMAAQVAAGMAYLIEQNCIHRNLAARNILIGNNFVCKVADFGLTEIFKDHVRYPSRWTAPEVTTYDKFTKYSDTWSFGIVLYEMITYGRLPYPGMTLARYWSKYHKAIACLDPLAVQTNYMILCLIAGGWNHVIVPHLKHCCGD